MIPLGAYDRLLGQLGVNDLDRYASLAALLAALNSDGKLRGADISAVRRDLDPDGVPIAALGLESAVGALKHVGVVARSFAQIQVVGILKAGQPDGHLTHDIRLRRRCKIAAERDGHFAAALWAESRLKRAALIF